MGGRSNQSCLLRVSSMMMMMMMNFDIRKGDPEQSEGLWIQSLQQGPI